MALGVAFVSIVVALFGFLLLLGARDLDERGELPERLSRVIARLKPLKIWYFAPFVAGLVLIEPRIMLPLLFFAVLVAYLVRWAREFLFLMGLRDDDFPGQFDKPIWAFALIALGPVGLLVFILHRASHWSSLAEQAGPYRAKPAPGPELF